MDEPVDDGVRARTEQLRPAPDGRHHRVLERALPALDGDGLGDPAEDHRQVVPEDRPDHQRQEQGGAAQLDADERDRQGAGDGVHEERQLPAPVPPGQVEVAFDEGVARLQLVGQDSQRGGLQVARRARSLSGTGPCRAAARRRAGRRCGPSSARPPAGWAGAAAGREAEGPRPPPATEPLAPRASTRARDGSRNIGFLPFRGLVISVGVGAGPRGPGWSSVSPRHRCPPLLRGRRRASDRSRS